MKNSGFSTRIVPTALLIAHLLGLGFATSDAWAYRDDLPPCGNPGEPTCTAQKNIRGNLWKLWNRDDEGREYWLNAQSQFSPENLILWGDAEPRNGGWSEAVKTCRSQSVVDEHGQRTPLNFELPTAGEYIIGVSHGLLAALDDFKGRYYWTSTPAPRLGDEGIMLFDGNAGKTYDYFKNSATPHSVRCVIRGPIPRIFPRKQPHTTIRFNHSKHVNGMGLSCNTCHDKSATSDRTSKGTIQARKASCMQCHAEQIQSPSSCTLCHTDKNYKVVRTLELASPDEQTFWRNFPQYHYQDFSKNPHESPWADTVNCTACHSGIDRSTRSSDNALPPRDCTTCHSRTRNIRTKPFPAWMESTR